MNAQKRRRWLILAALAGLILALLALRARGFTFDWPLFLGTLRHMSWPRLSLAILFMFLTYVGRALRWEVMLRPIGAHVGLGRLTADTVIGFMAATLLGRLGEFVRPYLISVSAGVSFSSQLGAWILERLLDLLAVLLLFGFALTRVPSQGLPIGPGLRWTLSVGGYVAGGIGLLCLLILVLFRNFSEATVARILSALTFLPGNSQDRIRRWLATFSEGVGSTKKLGLLLLLIGYTALQWGLITATYVFFLQSFSETQGLKIIDVVVTLGFAAFGSAVQIPGVGGGLQITTIVVLNQIFGISLESASGIALLLWALTLVVVPVGLLCALHQGMSWKKMKQLALEDLPAEEPS